MTVKVEALRAELRRLGVSGRVIRKAMAIAKRGLLPVRIPRDVVKKLGLILAGHRRCVVTRGKKRWRVYSFSGYKASQTGCLKARLSRGKKDLPKRPLTPGSK